MTVGASRSDHSDDLWARCGDCFAHWLDGDATALDDLVALMTPVLWHVVRAYRVSEETAEDVIQTTWLALVRCRETIAEPSAVGGWLTTTARREAWRVGRSGARAVAVDDDDLTLRLPKQRSAETDAVANDESRLLWLAVDALPERCRRLLRVVAFENRPDYARLAVELGMPVGSIGPTRGRCLAKLRVALMQTGAVP